MRAFNGKPTKMTITEEELRDRVINHKQTDRAIAGEIGVCSVTVMHWRQRLGLASPYASRGRKPMAYKPKRRVRISREEVVRLYVTEGLSQRQIADRLGVTQGAVSQWLWKHQIKARPEGGRLAVIITEQKLRDAYLENKMTLKEIAKHFGCGMQTIRQNMRNYGISLDATELLERRFDRNKTRYPHCMLTRGYKFVQVIGHPAADSQGYVAEHRLVVEQAIGRVVESSEQVHHINLNKRDNRIENLTVLPDKSTHLLAHKYLERVAVYLLGLSPIRPEALDFGSPVFWGGKYVTHIDLISGRLPLPMPQEAEQQEETEVRIM